MHRIGAFFILAVTTAAATAHAGGDQDSAGAVREALGRGTGGDAKLPHAFVKTDAHIGAAPGAPLMIDGKGSDPEPALVFEHQDGARLLALDTRGARLMLWTPEDQLVKVVAHEAGVAASDSAAIPAAGGDGLFVEPGVIPDGAAHGDRVHVKTGESDPPVVDGWIAASALGFEFAPDHVGGAGWKTAIALSQILVDGKPIATADWDTKVHKLAKGRGEIGQDGWRARGQLVVAKPHAPSQEGTRDAMGPVARVKLPADAVAVPAGACLYDSAKNLVGAITLANTIYGKVAGDHLELTIDAPLGGYLALTTHGTGKTIERCSKH